MTFIDTNIFLRYLTEPVTPADQLRAVACQALFARVADGAEEITTSEAVLAEVVYVLTSPRQYAWPPADVATLLLPILTLQRFKISNKRRYLRALEIFAQHPRLDFEDALSAAYVERMQPAELYSYDRDFDTLTQLTRREPPPSP